MALTMKAAAQLPVDPDLAAAAQDIVQQWSFLASHPNLCTPAEAFITTQMEGGPALVFVHAYYPAAITLEQAHMHQAAGAPTQPSLSNCRCRPRFCEGKWVSGPHWELL